MATDREIRIIENLKVELPIVKDLQDQGYDIQHLQDLVYTRINYKNAIPSLIKWLSRIDNLDVKEAIVRLLAVAWAKPIANSALLAEFKRAPREAHFYRWAVANSLSITADASSFEEIKSLITNKEYGTSRQMLALALGNMKSTNAEDVLIECLQDSDIDGHAIIGLRKLKSKKAYPYILPFCKNEKSWIRNEAKKAISAIEKAHPEIIID